MKVPEQPPRGRDVSPAPNEAPVGEKRGRFREVLDAKRTAPRKRQDDSVSGRGDTGEHTPLPSGTAPSLSDAAGVTALREFTAAGPAPAGAAAVESPMPAAALQLVQEIVTVAGPGGNPAVEIQFDSQVFDGLRVRVARAAEGVSIRLAAASEQTAALLSRHVDQLGQALDAKGVHVAAIQVQNVSAPRQAAESPRSGRDSSPRREGGGQRQGGGQQRPR